MDLLQQRLERALPRRGLGAEVVALEDKATEERWLGFAQQALSAGSGSGSMLCLQLFVARALRKAVRRSVVTAGGV